MELHNLLDREKEDILSDALDALARGRSTDRNRADTISIEQLVTRLFDLTRDSAKTRNLTAIREFVQTTAKQRFESGSGLFELQSAFNVLEEAIWRRIAEQIPPDHLPAAMGLVGTVLGSAKDLLAETYVSLATQSKAPSLDLRELFKGSEGF